MKQTLMAQTNALLAYGRTTEALALTEPLATASEPTLAALSAHAMVLKKVGRRHEAIAFARQAVERFPENAVAWHNLGVSLNEIGAGEEAVAAFERARAGGVDVGETWSGYANALTIAGRLEEANTAFEASHVRKPDYFEAARDHANMLWMWTGDAGRAGAVLDRAVAAGAPEAPIIVAKAKIFEAAGRRREMHQMFVEGLARHPDDLGLLLAAAQANVEDDRLDVASALAERARNLSPLTAQPHIELTIVRLAQGRNAEALECALRASELAPLDQAAWGWVATAARLVGDPRYESLYDYDRFVRPYDIDAPPGWPDMGSFLADLKTALVRRHPFGTEPADQSLRRGTQTMSDLTGASEPPIRALFAALDAPIRAHMEAIGADPSHPLTSRNTGRYRYSGSWSVLLKPDGYHVDHFHGDGWLSSAFYVETPGEALDRGEREGWIRFGKPPFRTIPELDAARYIRPQPGRLVLFPSYMWHGTVPFRTQESRMTVAFDVVPA